MVQHLVVGLVIAPVCTSTTLDALGVVGFWWAVFPLENGSVFFLLWFPYNVRPPLDSQVGEHKSNNYGLWYANNYSYWGESKPTYNWGRPHCMNNETLCHFCASLLQGTRNLSRWARIQMMHCTVPQKLAGCRILQVWPIPRWLMNVLYKVWPPFTIAQLVSFGETVFDRSNLLNGMNLNPHNWGAPLLNI